MSVQVIPPRQRSLDTTGWCQKMQSTKTKCAKNGDRQQRPETATLEKPRVLDQRLVRKLDMTTVSRRRLLAIDNLVDTRCVQKETKKKKQGNGTKDEDSWEDEESSAVDEPKARKLSKALNTTYRVRPRVRKSLKEMLSAGPHPEANPIDKILDTVSVQAPCCTCGRPEQPERFHTHPRTSSDTQQPTSKSSVRKPVPIKFHSAKKRIEHKDDESGKAKGGSPDKKNQSLGLHSAVVDTKKEDKSPKRKVVSHIPVACSKKEEGHQDKTPPAKKDGAISPAVLRRPRTVVCYLCSREFGTASFQIHEPHCMQRWQRENESLPKSLQRSLPVKPDRHLSPEEWNKLAWDVAQASLVPCPKCRRTFLPTRLEAHSKVCTATHRSDSVPVSSIQVVDSGKELNSAGDVRTPSCYICGRVLRTSSIVLHESRCLQKWRAENSQLPAAKRRPEPLRPETGQVDVKATDDVLWQCHLTQLVPCAKCGRTFNPERIGVHEKCCKGRLK